MHFYCKNSFIIIFTVKFISACIHFRKKCVKFLACPFSKTFFSIICGDCTISDLNLILIRINFSVYFYVKSDVFYGHIFSRVLFVDDI